MKTSLLPDPGEMVNCPLVVGVSPVDAAINVYVLAALNIRPLNVATPLVALTWMVPLTPAGVEDMLICALEDVTTFENWSSILTTTAGVSACPAVPLVGGVVNTP